MPEQEVLRICFKNVHQGDCIIIEWLNDHNQWEIGMIDCNELNNSMKSIKEHLLTNPHGQPYTELSFLVVSHPHSDHYSGINQILDFCEKKGIGISRIIHTCLLHNSHEFTALQQMFKSFKKWEIKGTKLRAVQNPSQLIESTSSGVAMRFLAPDTPEIDAFIQQTLSLEAPNQVSFKDGKSDANNSLSTILHIHHNNWQVLLTSDATIPSFERIHQSNESHEKPHTNKKIIVAQTPHHGSEKNHCPDFWEDYLCQDRSHVFVSSGQNKKYNHPSKTVIEYFADRANKVWATNFVHGYAEVFSDDGESYGFSNNIMNSLDRKENGEHTRFFSPKCGEQLVKIYKNGDCEITTNPTVGSY
jgi:competence protein ComEC